MSIPLIFVVIAIILAAIDTFRSQGHSLTGWAVILVCASLLWGQFG